LKFLASAIKQEKEIKEDTKRNGRSKLSIFAVET
jgi:hypothetical protein